MWNNTALSLKPFMKDFHGGQVVKTLSSNAGGVSSVPGCGAKIRRPGAKKTKHETETIL